MHGAFKSVGSQISVLTPIFSRSLSMHLSSSLSPPPSTPPSCAVETPTLLQFRDCEVHGLLETAEGGVFVAWIQKTFKGRQDSHLIKWLKPRPESGRDCLICAEFAERS